MSRKGKKMEILLFLGAGASASFDYPTTKGFIEGLKKQLVGAESSLLDSLLSLEHVKDIEHVIEILDALDRLDEHPLRELFNKFKLSMSFPGLSANWVDILNLCKTLNAKIRDSVFSQYQTNPNITERIDGVYSALFDKMMAFGSSSIIDIFTTNYDRVIEEFCAHKPNFDLIDGFVLNESRMAYEWQPEIFEKARVKPSKTERVERGIQIFEDRETKNYQIRLFKLHGSLNWRLRTDNQIERVGPEEKISATLVYKDNILIYPATKTKPNTQPFTKLHDYLRSQLTLKDLCIVIGFSFRDDSINDIFLELLKENEKLRLLLISPDVEFCLRNLIRDDKKLERRCNTIKDYFGKDENAINLIEKALEVLSTGTNIQIKLPSGRATN